MQQLVVRTSAGTCLSTSLDMQESSVSLLKMLQITAHTCMHGNMLYARPFIDIFTHGENRAADISVRCQAYVTPQSLEHRKPGGAASASMLPAHMMPSLITALEKMPLLFIGDSIDRGALPMPDWAAADAVYVAPINGLEEQLQAVWRGSAGRRARQHAG